MYRYSVDNAITYTSGDFVLFKESPFASWMERLTLENPDHGIEPDPGSEPPVDSLESQADLVVLSGSPLEEPMAMRELKVDRTIVGGATIYRRQ